MNRVSTRQNGNVTHCVEKKLQQLVDYVILSQTICRVGDSHLWPLCQAYMTQLVEQCSSLYERHNSMLWNSPQSKQDSYDALLFPHNYGSSPSVLNSNNLKDEGISQFNGWKSRELQAVESYKMVTKSYHTFCSGKSSPRLLLCVTNQKTLLCTENASNIQWKLWRKKHYYRNIQRKLKEMVWTCKYHIHCSDTASLKPSKTKKGFELTKV